MTIISTARAAFESLPQPSPRPHAKASRVPGADFAPIYLELSAGDSLHIWRGPRERGAPVDYASAIHLWELQYIDNALAMLVGAPHADSLSRDIILSSWMQAPALAHLETHPATRPARPAPRIGAIRAAWAKEHLPPVIVTIEGGRVVPGDVRGTQLDFARVHLPDGRVYTYAWDTIAHCLNTHHPLII